MAKVKNKKNANLADRVHKKKSDSNKKKLNPFEVHINREKLKVLGKKSKHDRGLPGVSRAKAVQKRKETLGTEMKLMNKTNAFIDRRIGEKNTQLSAEDRMIARFAAERAKQHNRKSIYNLADDEILTHRGQTLEQIEKFDDPRSSDEEEDGKKFGGLDDDFVGEGHFGGGILTKSDTKDGAKSHKDLIEQLIAESKKRKAEKQKEKEQTLDLTEKLDTEWKDLQPVVFKRQKVAEESLIDKLLDKEEKGLDYDKMMRELRFEKRGTPSDGLKSQEKIEAEERKKIEELEKQRHERMFSEEEMLLKRTAQPASKHRSADDLDDNFDLDDEENFMLAYDKDGKPLVPDHILKDFSVPNAKKKFEDGISDTSEEEDSEEESDDEEQNEGEENEDSNGDIVHDTESEGESDASDPKNVTSERVISKTDRTELNKTTSNKVPDQTRSVDTSVKPKEEFAKRFDSLKNGLGNNLIEDNVDNESESDTNCTSDEDNSKVNKKTENMITNKVTANEMRQMNKHDNDSHSDESIEVNEDKTKESNKFETYETSAGRKAHNGLNKEYNPAENDSDSDSFEHEEDMIKIDKLSDKVDTKLSNKNINKTDSTDNESETSEECSEIDKLLTNTKFSKLKSQVDSDLDSEKGNVDLDVDDVGSYFDIKSSGDINLNELLSDKTPVQQSTIIAEMIKKFDPGLAENNKEMLSKIYVHLLQYTNDLFSSLNDEVEIMKSFLVFDKLVPQFYTLAHINKVSSKKFLVEVLKEKHDQFMKNTKRVPDLDTLIFFKLTSVLYPTSDFRHPVATPSLIFMAEILTKCKFRDVYSLSRGLFVVSLILEYTFLSKRYEPSAINFLRGIFYLSANISVLNPIQVVPPFKLHKDVQLLKLERDCSKLKFEDKMAVKDLVTEIIDDKFKIRVLATSVRMLKEFFDKYNDFECLKAIFEHHIQLLDRIDLELYPMRTQVLVSDVLQHMRENLDTKTYILMAKEKVKPKALRLYEPDIQDVFTGSKNSKLSRENTERVRIQAKYKKEMKGALREIRRDKAYIASVKIRQKIHGDNVRKEKVKQIYKDASIQQGELNKLKRSK